MESNLKARVSYGHAKYPGNSRVVKFNETGRDGRVVLRMGTPKNTTSLSIQTSVL